MFLKATFCIFLSLVLFIVIMFACYFGGWAIDECCFHSRREENHSVECDAA